MKYMTYILFTRREKDKALRLRDAKEKRLYFELGATTDDGVEINSENAGEFTVIGVSAINYQSSFRTTKNYAVFVVVSASSRMSSVIAVRSRKYRRTRAACTGLLLLYHAVNVDGV